MVPRLGAGGSRAGEAGAQPRQPSSTLLPPDPRRAAAPREGRFSAAAARLCPRECSPQNRCLPGHGTAPPETRSQARGAAKTQLPAVGVDFEVTHSSVPVPGSSSSASSSTPLTFKSKLAASMLAKIPLPPFTPTGAAAASPPEPRAPGPALLRSERWLQAVLGTH